MPQCPTAWLSGLLVLAVLEIAATGTPDILEVGSFSEQDPSQSRPDDWQPISFAKIDAKTQYDLVKTDRGTVVRARSNGGAAGLATEQHVDLTEYPVLEWRWKVNSIVKDGNARTKDGDDYAARLYVTFDYKDLGFTDRVKLTALRALGYDQLPTRALNYVWANRIPRDTMLANAFTDWVMMVPVQSGNEHAGEWQTERRNVLEDYRAAFGGDPPPVNGVAIMTDTDNTNGKATAYYGDIVFRSTENPLPTDP
ncbi:hypothetical protein BSZ35_14845 [Salinibacter sp. 10B]|nr:hypothetical protein BSZ35_14845 [Salinibacter sp. 10B]